MTAPRKGRGHVLWVKAWWRGSRGKWVPVVEAVTLHVGWSARRLLFNHIAGSSIEYRILPSGKKPRGTA